MLFKFCKSGTEIPLKGKVFEPQISHLLSCFADIFII